MLRTLFIPEQFTVEGPPSFIWEGGGGASQKMRHCYSSLQLTYTYKTHTKHYPSLQLTYTFKTRTKHKKLRRLALCAFIYLRFSSRHENTKPQNIATKRCRWYDHIIGIDKIPLRPTWSPCPTTNQQDLATLLPAPTSNQKDLPMSPSCLNIESKTSPHVTPCPHIVSQMYD